MLLRILKWILKLVDVNINLDGDILSFTLELGNIKVLDLVVDLIKDRTDLIDGSVRRVTVKRKKR